MESAQFWRSLFENWPETIERQGTVVSKQGESVPFINFLISGGLVLLERSTPDPMGSRKAVVSYDSISLIKLNSPAPLSQFQSMGFQPTL